MFLQMGGPEMLAHHIAAFLSVGLASLTNQAHMYTLLLLSTEMTTPFVNARWILDQMVSYLIATLSFCTSKQECVEQASATCTNIPELSCRGYDQRLYTRLMAYACSSSGLWAGSCFSSGFSSTCGSISPRLQICEQMSSC